MDSKGIQLSSTRRKDLEAGKCMGGFGKSKGLSVEGEIALERLTETWAGASRTDSWRWELRHREKNRSLSHLLMGEVSAERFWDSSADLKPLPPRWGRSLDIKAHEGLPLPGEHQLSRHSGRLFSPFHI